MGTELKRNARQSTEDWMNRSRARKRNVATVEDTDGWVWRDLLMRNGNRVYYFEIDKRKAPDIGCFLISYDGNIKRCPSRTNPRGGIL